MSGKKSMAGLDNYVKLLSDEGFRTSFLFNLKLGVFTIIGSNLVSFVLAYFLNKNIRAKYYFRSVGGIYLDIYLFTDSAEPGTDDALGLAGINQLVRHTRNGDLYDHPGVGVAADRIFDDDLYCRTSDHTAGHDRGGED